MSLGRQLLRELEERPSGQQATRTVLAQGFGVEGREPIATLYGSAPELRVVDTEQTPPAGMFRWRLNADARVLSRATAADWSTTEDYLEASRISSTARLTVPIALRLTSGIGSPTAVADVVWLFGNDVAAGDRRLGITSELGSVIYIGNNTILFAGSTTIETSSGGITLVPITSLFVAVNDATANGVTAVLVLDHNTTGTPANGIGVQLALRAETSTTANTTMLTFDVTWVDVTQATRTSRGVFTMLAGAVAVEPLRMEGIGTAAAIGFLGASSAVRQASGANLTNNVTAGGTNDTIADYTDLVTYSNDAAAIRNDIYQISRKLKQVNDALRLYGLLT